MVSFLFNLSLNLPPPQRRSVEREQRPQNLGQKVNLRSSQMALDRERQIAFLNLHGRERLNLEQDLLYL
jgi:hypothetical protein